MVRNFQEIKYYSEEITKLLQEAFSRNGLCDTIVSGNAPELVGKCIKLYCTIEFCTLCQHDLVTFRYIRVIRIITFDYFYIKILQNINILTFVSNSPRGTTFNA